MALWGCFYSPLSLGTKTFKNILLLPSCLAAGGKCGAPGGHEPGAFQRNGKRWSLLLELHQQRKSSRLVGGLAVGGRPRGWWETAFLSSPAAGQPATLKPGTGRRMQASWLGGNLGGPVVFRFVPRPASKFCLSHRRCISCLLWGK